MDTIGERLRIARKNCGLTMKQLHDLTGLSTGNISDLENGRYAPSVAALISLSQSLEKSLDWIITGNENGTRVTEQKTTCDGIPISQAESDLIAMFRLLDERAKEDVFDFLTMKYEKATGEKGSIYSTYIEDKNARKKSGPPLGLDTRDGTA